MQLGQIFFLFTVATKLVDIGMVVAVWWLSWYLRFSANVFPLANGVPPIEVYSTVSLPLALIFSAVLHIVGAYRADRVKFGFRAAKKIFEGATLSTLVLVSYLYFTELTRFSRLYLLIFGVLSFLGLMVGRLFMQMGWTFIRRQLISPLRVLLIGYGDLLKYYLHEFESLRPFPIHWIGRLGPLASSSEMTTIPYLGEDDLALSTVRSQQVDKVVISFPSKDPSRYEPLLAQLSHELASIKIIPDFGKFSTFTYQAGHELGIPVLEFNGSPMGSSDRAIKRLMDIVGSILFLILFAPLYAILALCVRFSSPGPVIYSQKRMGADGKVFSMYKFRSMPLDAEKKTGAVWAVKNDDRVTKIGGFLRRTSLDELPQFFNVLKGDMSLVGPRPERPVFVEQFRDQVPRYMLRHKVRSGITGWAQIHGWRGNTSLEERINHDLFYIQNWSLLLDLKILILTPLRGLVHPNAY
ncbi:MAG: undecaprenyl-phosphate glucose phosphotransferase [Proteobacteria bacterium]|nr:undecaprenyl-phosphate glucose phosphotransferase [Pseudomonadota bacterium]